MNAMLVLYGVPNSQPVRAVAWTCLIKRLPFQFVMTSQNRDAKTEAFRREVNPRGTIPAIDDGGFCLWESPAILIYLCEKHDWKDLWPENLQTRARVNQYLHFHHRNTRELVIGWSRSLWKSVFEIEDPDEAWYRRNTFPGLVHSSQVVADTLGIIDGMLQLRPYLAADNPTIADIVAYEEIGQNQPRYANCLDYSDYGGISSWLVRMASLPFHDEAHLVWSSLGDVNQVRGGFSAVANANRLAAAEFERVVATF